MSPNDLTPIYELYPELGRLSALKQACADGIITLAERDALGHALVSSLPCMYDPNWRTNRSLA